MRQRGCYPAGRSAAEAGDAATLRAGAEREVKELRQAAEGEANELRQAAEAAKREAADHEAADWARAGAEREVKELRQVAGAGRRRPCGVEAERKANELRQAAEWRATTLRTEAQREVDGALRTAAQREGSRAARGADCKSRESPGQRSKSVTGPTLSAKGEQDSAVASMMTPGSTARFAEPGPDATGRWRTPPRRVVRRGRRRRLTRRSFTTGLAMRVAQRGVTRPHQRALP